MNTGLLLNQRQVAKAAFNYDLKKQVEKLQSEVSAKDKRIAALTYQLKSAGRLIKAVTAMEENAK